MQKLSEPVLVDCPDCAKPTLKKLISLAAFRLKGTGWYETDFKNSKKSETTTNQPRENGGKTDETANKEGAKSAKPDSGGGKDASGKSAESSERSDSPKA